jgi:hypothetical protein
MQTPKRPLKDKVKIAKAVIKTVFKPKSKEEKLKSKSSKKDWNKEQAALKNEFGDYKKGGVVKEKNWIQDATASIKNRGTAGKCTPITKPGCTGKAKTLAKTFKKITKNK